jgi:Glyoxalase-like domain
MRVRKHRELELRQVALVARDIDATLRDLTEVLGLTVCCRDLGVEQFGLSNALMAFGGTFLEVVSPKRPETTAGRLLDRRRGDGGYMILVQTDDLDTQRKKAEAASVEIVLDAELEGARLIHLHPKKLGAIVSFDELSPPDHWVWAGPDYKRVQGSDLVEKIRGVVVQSDDPDALSASWAKLFDRPVSKMNGSLRMELDEGAICFTSGTDDRGPGVAGIQLEVKDSDEILRRARERDLSWDSNGVAICGVRFDWSS